MTQRKNKEDFLKLGRPTDYRESMCDKAIKFLSLGKNRAQLCRHLQIAHSTLQLWEKTHPAFSAAVAQGHVYSEAVWSDRCEEHLENKNLNVKLFELRVMNQFGWNRKIESKQEIDVNLKETSDKATDVRNAYAEKYKKDF